VLDPNRAHAADPHPRALERLQSCRRQRSAARQVRSHLGDPTTVPGGHQLTQPPFVRRTAGKVPTATQQQSLRDRLLEVPMRGLGVAVFMPAVRIGRLRGHAIMGQKRLVVGRELLRVPVLMHGQRHPVRPMTLRYRPQRPHRILPAAAETREALGGTHRHVLPVRMRQHEVINQMVERLALKGHLDLIHRRKIRRRQPARWMLLGEKNLLGRTVLGLPLPDTPFQRPSHGGRTFTRIRLLQPVP
jgi:hypothetical protein